MRLGRRAFISTATLAAAAGTALPRSAAAPAPTVEPGADNLRELTRKLEVAPRRRDFKSVPMILDDPAQWDDAALREVIAYGPKPKQVWDNTVLESPWLNLMRNSLNAQVFSFRHPDFLVVSATHGSAHLALYDQTTWDKYQLTRLAGEKFKANTLLVEKKAGGQTDHQDPKGLFSPAANSIPNLMRRGVVFMACHNAIWEQAAKLIETNINPDNLSHEALTAELTNHLIEGVVLTPGAVATLPELQMAGFEFAKLSAVQPRESFSRSREKVAFASAKVG